jgi:hypothetical protein
VADKKSSSSPKSILKTHDESHDEPKSILKTSKSEDLDHLVEVNKTILKKGSSFDEDGSTPKSILKKSHEDDLTISQDPEMKSILHTNKKLLEASPYKKTPPDSKQSLLNSVQLDPSDDNAENTMSSTKQTSSPSSHLLRDTSQPPSSVLLDKPVPAARKSILKPETDAKTSPSGRVSNVPKAKYSNHSPESSVVFSSSKTPSAIPENHFSAFTLNDSMDLINVRTLHDGSDNKVSGKSTMHTQKTAWQIEMEARQGIRPKDNKVDMESTKPKHLKDDDKPQWKKDAEKRQQAKNSAFDDPEKCSKPYEYKSSPPPLPRNPPNFQVSPPPRPSNPPASINDQKTPTSNTSGTKKNSPRDDVAPDFVNSEVDIFGRTSNYNVTNRGLNRSPAFKISPDSSPKTDAKNANNARTDHGSNGVTEETIYDNAPTPPPRTKKKIIPDTAFSFNDLNYEVNFMNNNKTQLMNDVPKRKV